MTLVPANLAPEAAPQSSESGISRGRRVAAAGARRSARLLRQTPGRLALGMALVLTLIAGFGAAAVTDSANRAALIGDASGQQGRMSIAAFDMYRALSEANSVATEAFLPGLTTQTALEQDYEAGLGRVSDAMVTMSIEAATQDQVDLVSELSQALPVYSGLVETARTYHRQHLPLGLAYLISASALAHEQMLPKIKQLQNTAMQDLAAAKDDAVGFPWAATVAALGALGALAYWQVWLARRTNRMVNPGLAAASVIVLAASVWSLAGWNSAAGHMDDAHSQGAQPLAALSEAHIDAHQARGNEALALLAQGAGTDYEAEFDEIINDLTGDDGSSGTLADMSGDFVDSALVDHIDSAAEAASQWHEAHAELRAADDSGDFDAAVASAVGGDPGDAGAAFAELDGALSEANAVAAQRFTDDTAAAGRALTGLSPGVAVASLAAMIAAALGMQRRISEYK